MGILKGKVKFFDAEKGYGYICDLENTEHDYKVTIANVIGLEPPKQGDTVSFEAKTIPENGKKGVAVSVRIEESYELVEKNNDDLKTTCPHCGCHAVHKVCGYGTKRCIKCTREIETERSKEEMKKAYIIFGLVCAVMFIMFLS